MKSVRHILSVLVLCCLPLAAHAHRAPEAVVTMVHASSDFGPTTQMTVRIHADDAIKLLRQVAGITEPDLNSAAEMAALDRYIGARFSVSGGPAGPVGAELDGNYVFIYREVPGHQQPVAATLLSELGKGWFTQVTLVPVTGAHQSFLYHGKDGRTRPHRH